MQCKFASSSKLIFLKQPQRFISIRQPSMLASAQAYLSPDHQCDPRSLLHSLPLTKSSTIRAGRLSCSPGTTHLIIASKRWSHAVQDDGQYYSAVHDESCRMELQKKSRHSKLLTLCRILRMSPASCSKKWCCSQLASPSTPASAESTVMVETLRQPSTIETTIPCHLPVR